MWTWLDAHLSRPTTDAFKLQVANCSGYASLVCVLLRPAARTPTGGGSPVSVFQTAADISRDGSLVSVLRRQAAHTAVVAGGHISVFQRHCNLHREISVTSVFSGDRQPHCSGEGSHVDIRRTLETDSSHCSGWRLSRRSAPEAGSHTAAGDGVDVLRRQLANIH